MMAQIKFPDTISNHSGEGWRGENKAKRLKIYQKVMNRGDYLNWNGLRYNFSPYLKFISLSVSPYSVVCKALDED